MTIFSVEALIIRQRSNSSSIILAIDGGPKEGLTSGTDIYFYTFLKIVEYMDGIKDIVSFCLVYSYVYLRIC